VAFRETLEPAKLQPLKGVAAIQAISDKEWELQTKEPDEVKKQLLELALQNNWNIVSLQSENRSLEAIFRSLTN
jgi:ABC-2 type transport system ATP-binding protein